jgi:hypothetical protein
MSCTLLFSTTTLDHAVAMQREAGLSANLGLSSAGPGLPPQALAAVRSTARRRVRGRDHTDDTRTVNRFR